MAKSDIDLTGRRFGRWTVLRKSDRHLYWWCRCDCGREKEVYYSSLLGGKSHSCSSCANRKANPATAKAYFAKAKAKEGQTINGWIVVEAIQKKKNNYLLCRAICPKCKKEVTVKLSRLQYISQCAKCTRDLAKKTDVIHDVTYVDGSSLSSVRSRANGHVNHNSSTGVNGVSRMSNGRYRAYINFRRKQYNLGSFDTSEEASAARKEAEKLIYAPFLEKHEGWEEELSDRLAKLKNSQK